jgi:hypothetical protein
MRRALFAFVLAVGASSAGAHTGERGFVMLLPTGLYIAGGALAVVLSFVVMALLPSRALSRFTSVSRAEPRPVPRWPSAIVLALVLALLAAGWFGSRDPLENPLPSTVWMLWWVGFTFLVALLGDLWRIVNPWRCLATTFAVRKLPEQAGSWPAVGLFLAFAWFELVYPAPQDPEILAFAVAGYLLLTIAAATFFGTAAWMARGEAFSVFFRMVARLAPPWRGLLAGEVLPPSLVAFVLLALASVSFDGLSRTFWWLGVIGENPLEHPGRSALVAANSAGLILTFLALLGCYSLAAKAGAILARVPDPGYGYYVVAIVPIAFAYHFAHYFPTFLVDSQYAVKALSDPFDLGWNLLGTRDLHVTTSFLSHHAAVEAIWNVQVAAIVAAHVAAVFVAHVLALRRLGAPRTALVSQVPMTVLMVGYTVFGLWLLSTPVAG